VTGIGYACGRTEHLENCTPATRRPSPSCPSSDACYGRELNAAARAAQRGTGSGMNGRFGA
jgi:hypothetical protein